MANSGRLWLIFCLMMILTSGCADRYQVAPEPTPLSVSLKDLVDHLDKRMQSIQTSRSLLTIHPAGRPPMTGSLSFSRSASGGPPSLRLKGFDLLGRTLFDLISVGDRVRAVIPAQQRIIESPSDQLDDPSLPMPGSEMQQVISIAVGPLIELDETPVLEQQGALYIVHLIRVSATGSDREGRLTKRLWFERHRLRLIRAEWFGRGEPVHGEPVQGEPLGEGELFGDGDRVVTAVEFQNYQTWSGIDWPGRMIVIRLQDESRLTLEFHEVHFNIAISPEEFQLP